MDVNVIQEDPFIHIHEGLFFPETEPLLTEIVSRCSYAQSLTNVRMNRAYTKIYSPHKHKRDDFKKYYDWLESTVDYGKLDRKGWALDYEPHEATAPHTHDPATFTASAIHYLRADVGCGILCIKDQNGNELEIIPEDNLLVVFDSDVTHYVLPAENKNARRTCMVFNYLRH